MILAAVVLMLASVRTWTGSAAWRSDLTLFTMAARSAPRSVRVLGSLGTQLALQGRFPEAREWLERAIAIAPEFAPNRITLAGVLLHEGRLEEAEQEARAAVGFDPENPIPHAQTTLRPPKGPSARNEPLTAAPRHRTIRGTISVRSGLKSPAPVGRGKEAAPEYFGIQLS